MLLLYGDSRYAELRVRDINGACSVGPRLNAVIADMAK